MTDTKQKGWKERLEIVLANLIHKVREYKGEAPLLKKEYEDIVLLIESLLQEERKKVRKDMLRSDKRNLLEVSIPDISYGKEVTAEVLGFASFRVNNIKDLLKIVKKYISKYLSPSKP